MSPRKGFDADGGRFYSGAALLCCAVVWCAGPWVVWVLAMGT